MKKIYLYFTVFLFMLSACNSIQGDSELQYTSPNSETGQVDSAAEEVSVNNILESESENAVIDETAELEFIKIGEFFDIGSYLYPDGHNIGLQGQFIDGAIHIWGGGKTFRYDYTRAQVLGTYNENIIPLGLDHYYSCSQKDESNWVTILYDKNLTQITEHTGKQFEMPSINGQYMVSIDKTITVLEVSSGKSKSLDLLSLFGYEGSIWASVFDGEKIYFSASMNPFPGKEGIGYYDIISGQSALFEDYDWPFSGMPEYIGQNQVWYWQDGSGFGTDGTYGVLLHADKNIALKVDINDPTCKMSNGKIISVGSSLDSMGFGKINDFKIYFGDDFKQNDTISIVADNAPLYRASHGGLQISKDMRYICIYAASNNQTDLSIPQLSIFLYRLS